MPTSYIARVVPLIPPSRLFPIIVLLVAYFITARFGLSINAVNGFATLVWPPTGIALAALLIWGYELWPAILLGAFLVNFSIGAPLLVAVGIAVGNTLEAVAGTWLLRRFGFSNSFGRLRDAWIFVFAALLAPLISASIGVASLFLGETISSGVFETWSTWWVGDMLGALVFAPFLLTWLSSKPPAKDTLSFLEVSLLLFALIAFDSVIFLSSYGDVYGNSYKYVVFFPLTWALLRFGARGKATVIFVTAMIAMFGTVLGHGPFGQPSEPNLLGLQIFIASISVVFLLLASIAEERRRLMGELEEYVDKLEGTLQRIRLESDGAVIHLPAETPHSVPKESRRASRSEKKESDDPGK